MLVIVGGYVLTAGVVGLAATLLSRAGMWPSEASLLASMAGFVLLIAVVLWAFSERSLARVATVIGGSAAVSIGCALLFAPAAL